MELHPNDRKSRLFGGKPYHWKINGVGKYTLVQGWSVEDQALIDGLKEKIDVEAPFEE